MNASLAEKTCIPCRRDIPSLTREEAERLLAQAPMWSLREDAHRIEQTFTSVSRSRLLRQISELAEIEGHHPNISFGWGCVTVSLRTKKSKGLHERFHHGHKDLIAR